jgi:glycine betaine/choline ABC-type transport system substrate-binding protein
MKKTVLFLLIVFSISVGIQSHACVGRIINIGIVKSANETLLAELISVLINERTGTTVNIKVFDSSGEIYNAVKKEEISIVIENTDHAMNILNIQNSKDKKSDYDISKKEFREKMNLIWLKPLGFLPKENEKGKYYYSAVITEDVLINFPALPRVINKLKGISEDKRFNRVIKAARSGEKIRRIARDFLRKKKLI